MIRQPHHAGPATRSALAALAVLFISALPAPVHAQDSKDYGVAAKRPVLQASCKHCPWGALGDILKTIMAPAYDVAICYGCSGENGARYVSKRLMSAEVSDRLFAQGVSTRPDAPVDFGITQSEYVRRAYAGNGGYQKDGPFSNLRLIARIENPAWLMIAAVKSSGITDLRQIRDKKLPVIQHCNASWQLRMKKSAISRAIRITRILVTLTAALPATARRSLFERN